MYLTDIEKSIERILSTPLGSRVMEPTFGSELYLLIDKRLDDEWKLLFIKYVFEAMRMLKFTVGGHQRHWISIFSNLVIPIPKSHEQQKIAKVLSTADQEIEVL